jgi:molybdopterin-guanine dinucleotide biosynthesis protein A
VRAAEIFAKQIKERNFRLRDVLRKLRILYVDLQGSRYEDMLTNINTKEEYEARMRG